MAGNPHSGGAPAPSRGGAGEGLRPALQQVAGQLWEASGAAAFGLSQDDLAGILGEVASRYPDAVSAAGRLEDFCRSLRLQELVLARACAAGSDAAWEQFLLRYREKLYDAARGIARNDEVAHELADGVYADLFGTRVRDGERVSKLSLYMGRGSLEGWLRTVLAQEFVNRYRAQRRLVSLEEDEEAGHQFAAPQPETASPPDPRLEAATDSALASLPAEERFILASYFLDGRTLAEIARMLGVHESTVSRRLEKITGGLRKRILAGLARCGMSRQQAEEALEADVRDFAVDVRRRLSQGMAAGTFSTKEDRQAP